MASEEDKFDHEFYEEADGSKDQDSGDHKQSEADQDYDIDLDLGDGDTAAENGPNEPQQAVSNEEASHRNGHYDSKESQQRIASTDESAKDTVNIPRQPPQEQGLKRKGSIDERPMDPGATTALLISDLSWWHTEDDIRGWVNQAGVEDELKEITFSEHKVNGKSKGQAFADFSSPQAATASKHKVDSFTTGPQKTRKHNVTYTNPLSNPFKTLPKDGPQRGKDDRSIRSNSASYNSNGPPQNSFASNNFSSGGFRGGRGGYNNNRGASNMGGGYNRNFSGGFQGAPRGGGFQGSPMTNMQQNYGGFNQNGMMGGSMRGNPGGMRGGRGGLGGPNNMMPMGNMGGAMGMGPMGMANMNPMMANMGGFQGGNTHFNPAFFPQNTAGGDGSWNPHGAKRTRQE